MKKDLEKNGKSLDLAFGSVPTALSNAPGFIFYKNQHSRYLWCNNNFAKLAGCNTYLDLLNKTDFDLNLDRTYIEQSIVDDQQVLCTGDGIKKEYKLPCEKKAQGYLYLHFDKIPLYDEGKQIIGLLATGIDITEEKTEQIKAIETSQFIQNIFYNLPGLIYWKNMNLEYMGFNKNVVQLSGLGRENLVGKSDLQLNWGEWEAEAFRRDDMEIISTGISKISEYEVPIKRSDNYYMIVKTLKSPLLDEKGNTIGILAVAIDITDQKLLERDLVEANERIKKLDQVKTEFIRNMEHDIRTPFTGLSTLSGILEKQEIDSEKKTYIKAINQSAKELLDYCNTILDFSKIESGITPVSEKKFHMGDLITHVIRLEAAAITANHLRIKKRYSSSIPKIFIGDAYRIERILVNLIGNAVKFTKEGEIVITVKLAKIVNQRECIIKLSVQDTGIGMPEDKIPMIFENFSRLTLSNQGQYRGMGLGLSIVKSLVADIKGEIEVSSKLGKGSTFICTIPLRIPLMEEPLIKGNQHE